MRKFSCLFKILVCVYACMLSLQAHAQYSLKGKVTNLQTEAFLPSVSIYINNSAKGTTTNDAGEFELKNINVAQFDIVASCIGYETFSATITAKELSQAYDIKLKPKSAELQAVIIQAYDKSGWKNWGKLFTEEIIGRMPYASDCEIKNNNVVKFIYNKKEQTLSAFADEPLIIINKYLGYELKYDMQTFVANFKTKIMNYEGYPFFVNLTGSDKKNKKWKENRKYAYEGSIMHFMRSIYRNTTKQEGFDIRVLQRFANAEKIRVRSVYKNLIVKENGGITIKKTDSLEYYQKILSQSDSLDFVSPIPISTDSIAYAENKTTAGISFNNLLQITHNSIKQIPTKKSFETKYEKEHPVSIISIRGDTDIFIFANGTYINPLSLLTEGYWGYSERLSNLLPVDYTVEE